MAMAMAMAMATGNPISETAGLQGRVPAQAGRLWVVFRQAP